MTRWTTVSVEAPTGEHFYRTEYGVWGQSQMAQSLPSEVRDLTKLSEFCIIACNDTGDNATISYSGFDEAKSTMPRDGDLWTVDVTFGPQYDWHENISEQLPDWCRAGGNWRKRIDGIRRKG